MRNKLCIISIMTLAIAGLGFTKVPTMPNNTVMADVVDDDDRRILPPQPIIDNNNGNAFENETTTSYVTEQPTISTDSKDTVVRKAPTIKAKKTKFTIKKKKGKKIKKVKNGTGVYVIHKIPNTGWYKVKVKGKTGYMKALKFKVKKKTNGNNGTVGRDTRGRYVIVNGRKIYIPEGSGSTSQEVHDRQRELAEEDGNDWGPSWRQK
ncbi:hypothetical protein [Eubacterium sp.]|uniref:hypothetical protein n=1 Tax=Eubacterium sp. TaxID=142586 RepID=UPI00399BD73B